MSVIKNLVREYGDFKIDIPHWELPDVGITALKGPSGSGKSSVIRLLLGLDSCPGLSWVLGGVDIAKLSLRERNLGVVFQSYELFAHMTARQNIEFAGEARGIERVELVHRIKNLSEKLHLKLCIDRPARVLSGGERQRVALARALVGHPRFLFLDEPFSALDADLKADARRLVKQIIDEHKIPTLLVSHDEADIPVLASSVVLIDGGRIV